MNSLAMDYRFESWDPSRRLKGIVIVVALHAFLGYVLISGGARKEPNLGKKPLEAVVIQEVIIPPPPPPPPPSSPPSKKIEKPVVIPKLAAPPPPHVPPPDVAPLATSMAPAIVSVATPPTAPAVIAPPPPPVAVGPKRAILGVACPTQVAPEMPRRALQDGTEGVVKAQIYIKDGVVQDVTILSGPRVFHAAVKTAMMQYTCITDGGEFVATQEFSFKVE